MILNNISSDIIETNMDIIKKCSKDYSDLKLDELKNYIYLFYRIIYNGNKFINKNYKYIKKILIINIILIKIINLLCGILIFFLKI